MFYHPVTKHSYQELYINYSSYSYYTQIMNGVKVYKKGKNS